MSSSNKINSLVEEFKIPFKDQNCPEDWKDWYHYILYDPKTNIRILYNICFNGKPETGYITDTFLITFPKGFLYSSVIGLKDEESFGFARNNKWSRDSLESSPLQFTSEKITFKINKDNILELSVKNDDLCVHLCLYGSPSGNPIYVPELAPYGKGFIGWGVMPHYTMSGEIWIQKKCIFITDDWYTYHDRNFGRFNWGKIGWTWFVAHIIDGGGNKWSYVFHKSNNSNFTKIGSAILFIHKNGLLQKVFYGDSMMFETTWSNSLEKPKVLPGSMASIFIERAIKVPLKLTLSAKDDKHNLFIEMYVKSFAELIIPDSESKDYTYMKEMSGDICIVQQLENEKICSKEGFYYGELVN